MEDVILDVVADVWDFADVKRAVLLFEVFLQFAPPFEHQKSWFLFAAVGICGLGIGLSYLLVDVLFYYLDDLGGYKQEYYFQSNSDPYFCDG